jgi:hypothetical protein
VKERHGPAALIAAADAAPGAPHNTGRRISFPFVGASLAVMERDSRLVRGERPFLFTNCRTGEGVEAVLRLIRASVRDRRRP